jgi:antitoxin HicB
MTMNPEYPVVLRPLSTDDGGGWVAIVPDLPGCMTDGATAHEALENAADAIEEWKVAARDMGRPVPHPDDSLRQSFEQAVPEHIKRRPRTTPARCLLGSQGGSIRAWCMP